MELSTADQNRIKDKFANPPNCSEFIVLSWAELHIHEHNPASF